MRKLIIKKNIKIVIFLFILISLPFLGMSSFWHFLKGSVADISSPVRKIFFQASQKTFSYAGAVFSLGDIIGENNLLKEQVAKLQADLSKKQEVERENIALREQLNLAPEDKLNSVLSNITGYDPANLGQYIFIDKGLSDGLSVGQPVVASGGILIGRIAEVFESSSKVQMLQDASSAVNVVSQETRSTGIIKGVGGQGLFMDLIQQDSNIKTGENIITSGLGGVLPKGLLVGQVIKVVSNDIEPFKRADIKSFVDTTNLGIVLVIINK